MILRRFDPLSCSLKRVHASMNMLFLMNKTKDQISRVSSHDLYWKNKMYKRKRSIRKLPCMIEEVSDETLEGKFLRKMVCKKSSSSNYLDSGNGFQGLGKPYSLQLSDIQMHALKDFLGYAHLLHVNVTGTLNIVNRLKTEDGTIFFFSRAYGRVKVRNSFTVKYRFNATMRYGQIDFFARYNHACDRSY